jgi:hypothetical protein
MVHHTGLAPILTYHSKPPVTNRSEPERTTTSHNKQSDNRRKPFEGKEKRTRTGAHHSERKPNRDPGGRKRRNEKQKQK